MKKLFKTFRDKAGQAVDAVSDMATGTAQSAADIGKMASDLASDMGNRAADIADVRRILTILDYIPFIPTQKIDNKLLNDTIAALQMGSISVIITYNKKKGADANVVRMDKISAAKVNEALGGNQFSSVVVSSTEDPDQPNIHMLLNKEGFEKNHKHITADLVVRALMQPVERIPLIGGATSAVLSVPCKMISRFVIGTIFGQAENIAGLIVKKPEDAQDTKDTNGPDTPAPKM